MLKKGLLKLFLITFVLSYILVTLYGIGANEVVVEGYNILFNAPIEQQGNRTILNINEFRKEPSLPILFAYRITYYTDASQSVVKGYYTKWLDIPKYGRNINSNSCYSDDSKKKTKVV